MHTNPHQDHLFEVRAEDGPKKDLLNEETASQFQSSHYSPVDVPLPKSYARYSNSSVVLRHEGKEPRYGRSEETETLYRVLEVYAVHEALFECR